MTKNTELNDIDLDSRDISDELKREIKLFRALQPYIGHCLSMNHDINNPLAGIIGFSEYLLMDEETLTKEQAANIKQIMKCAERIRKLMVNLCDHKMLLAEGLDLESITARYKKVQKTLD
ncbi:MAG: hypothetical protein DRJ65_22475 [Acidobacteria bacterium]|nr:MAG: hypothetical protein DRJ65_22475 [Acidobacteriota bacterium]